MTPDAPDTAPATPRRLARVIPWEPRDGRVAREGERAASRGASRHSNPCLLANHMPAATGESLRAWFSKHDAWHRGFVR